MKSSLTWLSLTLLAGCPGPTLNAYYWTTDTRPPPNAVVDGHPCGGVVILDADVVPDPDIPWLKAGEIREIDAQGRVLRSWRTPVDYYALGLIENDLIAGFGSAPMRVLRITPDGHLSSAAEPAAGPEAQKCPKPFEQFYSCIPTSTDPTKYLVSPDVCT